VCSAVGIWHFLDNFYVDNNNNKAEMIQALVRSHWPEQENSGIRVARGVKNLLSRWEALSSTSRNKQTIKLKKRKRKERQFWR
jgi:hypothetical protein